MRSIDDLDIEGKKVLLRTDLNLPVEDGEVQRTVRFERYADTIEELGDKGAKVVVVAHQGRPSRDDFVSLEDHVDLLSDELGQEVEFLPSFFGGELVDALDGMDDGDVSLLENIRFLSEELKSLDPEKHSHDIFVERFSELFDVYINDAFSAAHRSHGSLVGFEPLMESAAGPVMVKELESCRKIRDELDDPVLVLGGEKPSDVIGMLEQMIERVHKVLLGGVPGELALIIEGNELGEKKDWIEKHSFDSGKEELEELLEDYEDRIVVPEDVRSDSGNHKVGEVGDGEMVWDIGKKTGEKYAEIIEEANSVLMKGPMGAFDESHEEGSKAVIDALVSSDGFTVIGGGHTSSLVERFGHSVNDFDHVSIAGGAFVRFMGGEELPVVEALEQYS